MTDKHSQPIHLQFSYTSNPTKKNNENNVVLGMDINRKELYDISQKYVIIKINLLKHFLNPVFKQDF